MSEGAGEQFCPQCVYTYICVCCYVGVLRQLGVALPAHQPDVCCHEPRAADDRRPACGATSGEFPVPRVVVVAVVVVVATAAAAASVFSVCSVDCDVVRLLSMLLCCLNLFQAITRAGDRLQGFAGSATHNTLMTDTRVI